MILKNLALENFRNYTKKTFSFLPQTTIIIGPNTSGKTNLLEAIYLLSVGKSFRAEKDSEVITFGKEIGRVKAVIKQLDSEIIKEDSGEEMELEVVLTKGEVSGIKTPHKKFTANGVARKYVDFAGKLKVVLFWPENMELVTDSPTLRRRYLDSVLIQVDREYRRTLLSYERGLRQRNKLLEAIREEGAHRHQLMFWDQLLIRGGDYITKKREEYIDFINNFQFSIFNFQLFYDRSIISRQRLDQYSEEEIAAGATLVGPHRDDVIFNIKNKKSWPKADQPLAEKIENNEDYRDLASFGSRGEQRLAILWLKLGELSYIENTTGEKPVLLLDDILSELDHEHRKIIFEVIKNQQTIMTVTDRHFIEEKYLENDRMIELE